MRNGQSEAVLKPLRTLIEFGSLTGVSDRHLLERSAARRDEMSEAAFSALADAVKEAGLPAIPLDPYIAQPIRMVIVDGQPVVYCVGEDGQDDHGQKDAIQAPYVGDVLLRLPKH